MTIRKSMRIGETALYLRLLLELPIPHKLESAIERDRPRLYLHDDRISGSAFNQDHAQLPFKQRPYELPFLFSEP
jgi:hypothetical protein